jgi:hypothetical protein
MERNGLINCDNGNTRKLGVDIYGGIEIRTGVSACCLREISCVSSYFESTKKKLERHKGYVLVDINTATGFVYAYCIQ